MPLGRPVDPDEYIQNAMSSGPVSATSNSSGSPSTNADSAITSEPASVPFTMTTRSTFVPCSTPSLKLGVSDASHTASGASESTRK